MKTKHLLTVLFILFCAQNICSQNTFDFQCPFYLDVNPEYCYSIPPEGKQISYEEFLINEGSAYSDCGIDENSLILYGISTGENFDNWEYIVRWDFSIQDSCGNIEYCSGMYSDKIFVNRMNDIHVSNICGSTDDLEELTGLAYPTTPWITEITKEQFESAGGSFDESSYIPDNLWIGYDDKINNNSCPLSITRIFFFDDIESCIFFTISQEIVLEDSELPTLVCPPELVIDCNNIVPETFASFGEFSLAGGTATDNCGINESSFQMIDENITGDCPIVTTRIYQISDSCGNTSTCQHVITQESLNPLALSVPQNLTSELCLSQQEVDQAFDEWLSMASVAGGCTPVTLTSSHYGPPDFCGGSTDVTWVAMDECTSIAQTATFTVPSAPAISAVCPADLIVSCVDEIPLVPNPELSIEDFNSLGGSVFSECEILSIQLSEYSDNGICPEIITRKFEFTSACQVTTCTQKITVNDVIPPIISNPLDLYFECTAYVPAPFINFNEFLAAGGSVVDNCGIDETSFELIGYNSSGDCPKEIIRIYQIADNCGNTSEIQQVILIDDIIPPSFTTSPNPIEDIVHGDPLPVQEDLLYADNCGVETYTKSIAPYVIDTINGYSIIYLWRIIDSCGNTVSTPASFNVLPPPIKYCDSYGDASAEWIKTVTVGDETNSSGSVGYEDFTQITFNLQSSKSYTISLIPGFISKNQFEYWAVWIDFDGDGIFTETEKVFSADKKKSEVTGSITIPVISPINTRMRISMSNGGEPGPCDQILFGEVEDYTVNITEMGAQPPIANFSADKLVVNVGDTVQFTDLSENFPTNWEWYFEEGSPPSISIQNPKVIYEFAGTFDVKLTVSNVDGIDALLKEDFITVEEESSSYCESGSTSSELEWISVVSIGDLYNQSGSSLFSDFTDISSVYNVGVSYPVSLTPGFINKSQREYWNIWIDFNGDMDFYDVNENVFSAINSKFTVTGNILIPENAITGTTRMRISMKNASSPYPCGIFSRGEVEDYSVIIGDTNKDASLTFDESLDIENKEVRIYPNPANSVINVSLKGIFNPAINIYDTRGVLIIKENLTSDLREIDIRNIASGIYLLEVKDDYDCFREKFVKK